MSCRIIVFAVLIGSLYTCFPIGQGGTIKAHQQQPKADYRQNLVDMIGGAEWCVLLYKGDIFIVKIKKLDAPLKVFVQQIPKTFEKLDDTLKFPPDDTISFFKRDGSEIGSIGFWTESRKILPMIRFNQLDLPFDDDEIGTFLKDIKPALFRFENNTDALASKTSNLVQYSLRTIVQKTFKDPIEEGDSDY